jgi:hypothetical protein
MTDLRNAGLYRDKAQLRLASSSFDAALREAVRERGLTLDRLRSHLARRGISIGLSSLSDWQHGRSRPGSPKSLQAVHALEEILGLRRASLVELLSKGQPPETWNRARSRSVNKRGLDESQSPFAELLQEFPHSGDADLHVVTRSQKVYIDQHKRASLIMARTVVKARRDGIDRYLTRVSGDTNCDIDQVRFGSFDNCRLGRVKRHTSEAVLVAELLFDQPLRAGGTWVFEHAVMDASGDPCTEFGHGFVRDEDQYILEVRFDRSTRPKDLHVYSQTNMSGPSRRTADLSLNSHYGVHLVATNACAGVIGIAWTWDD